MLHEPNRFQPDMHGTAQIDEHDEPTEPMRRSDVLAFATTLPDASLVLDGVDVPSPKSATQPFPYQYVQPSANAPDTPRNVPEGHYPYLPSRIAPKGNGPAGGAHVQPEVGATAKQEQNVVRGLFPLAVGMCFVAVQMLLLVRFTFKLLNVSAGVAWVGAIYDTSSVFVLPFRLLFLQFSIPLLLTAEIYTLLAILCYGLLSRILVRVLKIFLKTR